MQRSSRNLLIINCHQSCYVIPQLNYLIQHIDGDWITITSDLAFPQLMKHVLSSQQAKQLLGQEFRHAIFDARAGFDLEAFAILSGTLIEGSLLILLLPDNFANWHDEESLRWNESSESIAVPNFVKHLSRVIEYFQLENNIFFNKINYLNKPSYLFDFISESINHTSLIKNIKTDEFDNCLAQIINDKNDIIVLTAKRGRGKSALAGLFYDQYHCWVTAPNKTATTTLQQFAPKKIEFFSPDMLIRYLDSDLQNRPEYLIIDEAAMIPLPILSRLLNDNYRVLLTTTLDGYEGTGQGLLLKLLDEVSQKQSISHYSLHQAIRWHSDDLLERFTESLIISCDNVTLPILGTHPPIVNSSKLHSIRVISQSELVTNNQLFCVFQLLKTSHYRTTLTDLRRLLDAKNIAIYIAEQLGHLIGALITIKEGQLSDILIDEIWAGRRRPKGNLVAQSLVAHAGQKEAARLSSKRVNRIAIVECQRRKGVGYSLIQQLINDNHASVDYLSVSFAYSYSIYQFWQKCGFILVHIGSHKEASSGCYAAMAIYPLSTAGKALVDKMSKDFARNWYWYQSIIPLDLPIKNHCDFTITDEDKTILLGFATTNLSYEMAFPALGRLAYYLKNHLTDLNNSLLLMLFEFCGDKQKVIKHFSLLGQRDFIKQLRDEVKNRLEAI